MTTRIEFIPYGEKWRPEFGVVIPGATLNAQRRPKATDRIIGSGATAVRVHCLESNAYTEVVYIDADGKLCSKNLEVGDGTMAIHRVAINSQDDSRGTLRITHTAKAGTDSEPRQERLPHLDGNLTTEVEATEVPTIPESSPAKNLEQPEPLPATSRS